MKDKTRLTKLCHLWHAIIVKLTEQVGVLAAKIFDYFLNLLIITKKGMW